MEGKNGPEDEETLACHASRLSTLPNLAKDAAAPFRVGLTWPSPGFRLSMDGDRKRRSLSRSKLNALKSPPRDRDALGPLDDGGPAIVGARPARPNAARRCRLLAARGRPNASRSVPSLPSVSVVSLRFRWLRRRTNPSPPSSSLGKSFTLELLAKILLIITILIIVIFLVIFRLTSPWTTVSHELSRFTILIVFLFLFFVLLTEGLIGFGL
uniref:Uncharacterized protein n=1 Tax=Anopheles culicifacies TaxID=139723 RepID=A0A182ME29_9DIPT